jgi:hypothetical protein
MSFQGFTNFPAPALGGYTLIEVPLLRKKRQKVRHKRKSSRRWQKKYLKRFGEEIYFERLYPPGQFIVDEQRGIIYAHAEDLRALRRELQADVSRVINHLACWGERSR